MTDLAEEDVYEDDELLANVKAIKRLLILFVLMLVIIALGLRRFESHMEDIAAHSTRAEMGILVIPADPRAGRAI